MLRLNTESLEIVAQQDNIHPEIRARLACTCSRMNELVKATKLDPAKIAFDSEINHTNRMRLTDARKLRLTDDDLKKIPHVKEYVDWYGIDATYYNKKEAHALRLAIYGSFYEKRPTLVFAKRIKVLEKMGISPSHVCAKHFLRNGKGGIPLVKERLSMCEQHDLPDFEWERIWEKKQNIKTALEQHVRRKELVAALAEYGLKLHSHNRVGNRYIRFKYGKVDRIVHLIRVKDIFYNHTNYREVLKRESMVPFFRSKGKIKKDAKRKVVDDERYKHFFDAFRSRGIV